MSIQTAETNKAKQPSGSTLHVTGLILEPGLITLAVTILRLAGELQGWSTTWFNPAPGGP